MKETPKIYPILTGLGIIGIIIYMTIILILRFDILTILSEKYNSENFQRLSKINHMIPEHQAGETGRISDDIPLLTIFTTFKEHPNNTHHKFAHSLVIENWNSFKSLVKPIVFVESADSELAKMAASNNWDVLPLTRVNPSGAPYLKDMYKTVFQKYNSTFYGFANGDLLFDDSLIETLREIKKHIVLLENNVLVVGIRTNVDIETYQEDEKNNFTKQNLRNISETKGKLNIPLSEDYFLFTRDGCLLNWTNIADVVIGRLAYDNYLVAIANQYKVNTIDATKTLLALHLSKKGVTTGRQNADKNFNFKIIGSFNYNLGKTTDAKFVTTNDFRNRPYILRR